MSDLDTEEASFEAAKEAHISACMNGGLHDQTLAAIKQYNLAHAIIKKYGITSAQLKNVLIQLDKMIEEIKSHE